MARDTIDELVLLLLQIIWPGQRGVPVRVKTTRFGELSLNKKDIIFLKDGLLGFDGFKEFFIVDPDDRTLIIWLQVLSQEHVAFPIIEVNLLVPGYDLALTLNERDALQIKGDTFPQVYSILTIPQGKITEISANLKAPLVINPLNGLGKQVIHQDNKLSVKTPVYNELKKLATGNFSDDNKRRPGKIDKIFSSDVVSRRDEIESNVLDSTEKEIQP